MKKIICITLCILLPVICQANYIETNIAEIEKITDPVKKGLAIADETERLDTGFGDIDAKATMTLISYDKVLSKRDFRMKTLEIDGDGDYTLNIFDKPRDVAGTAVLIYSHGLKPDDQWLYLPALKRVKRIATKSKSGPFVGSEFAYEDITTWVPEKFTYRFMHDETLEGHECFVVENTPAYEHSGYTRQHEWVDKKIFRPRRIDYFDRKGDLLKTLDFKGYRQYLEQYWRPDKMIMTNHQTGKITELSWLEYRFNTGLTVKDFTKNRLKRAR